MKLLRWWIFGAVISVLPLLLVYMALKAKAQPVDAEMLIGNGELLVIVWVLAASAIGELFGSSGTNQWVKVLFGGLTLIVIIVAAFFFSTVTEAHVNHVKVDVGYVVWVSKWLFAISLVPCSICILAS
jgi:hypothetical protein